MIASTIRNEETYALFTKLLGIDYIQNCLFLFTFKKFNLDQENYKYEIVEKGLSSAAQNSTPDCQVEILKIFKNK